MLEPTRATMIDFIYVLGTLAFFALMLLYVRACDALGHSTKERADGEL